jgi:hypothetical protein
MPHPKRAWTACAALVLLAIPSVRAQAPAAQPACSSAEHRQFDFWIGDWEVKRADGKPAGRNVITREHGGCVIHEQYTGVTGYTGASLNMYDPGRKRWHQTWVDNAGLLLELNGEFTNGAMVLRGETLDAQGKATLGRITWTPRADGTVRQVWEQSTDGGATWVVAFDGIYSKK